MNKLLVSLVLSLGVAGSAHALQGDAAAGAGKVAVCSACHGADGNSIMPNWPKLAGQGERYLLKQLTDVRDGARVVAEMNGMLANVGDQERGDVEAHLATQTRAGDVAVPAFADRGQATHHRGSVQ